MIVNPTFVLGPDDPTGHLDGPGAALLLGQIPVYVDGALNIVDVRDVAAGHLLADEKGEVGERYILGGRNFTLDRLFADLARISGVDPPPLKLPARVALGGAEAAASRGCRCRCSTERGALGLAVVDLPQHEGEARARLRAAPARGDARGRGRLAARRARRPPARGPERQALRVIGRALRAGERLASR